MKKNILLILLIILLIVLIIILLPAIFEKNKNFSIEKIKILEKKALFEHNKTAAEELVFINAKNNNTKKAKFWVDIVRKIENKK
jgi:hypothetical protein